MDLYNEEISKWAKEMHDLAEEVSKAQAEVDGKTSAMDDEYEKVFLESGFRFKSLSYQVYIGTLGLVFIR